MLMFLKLGEFPVSFIKDQWYCDMDFETLFIYLFIFLSKTLALYLLANIKHSKLWKVQNNLQYYQIILIM